MKPDFFDDLFDKSEPEYPLGPNDPEPNRLDDFPLLSGDENIGTYVMKFPKRFWNLWVIKPIDESYSFRFMMESRPRFRNEIIRPNKTAANGSLFLDRPYNWFYDVFIGNDSMEPLFGHRILENKSGELDFNYSLVDIILTHGDINLIDLWCCYTDERMIFANKDLPLWLTFLRSKIPTYLVSEQEMEKNAPSIIKGLVKRNPDDTIENLSEVMETLGVYFWREKPIIYICPKRIRKVANDLGINPDILFCIVYIHELAHAAMDQSIDAKEIPYNGDYEYSIIKTNGEYEFDDASNFMEESLANLIMLNYLEWYSEIEENESFFDTAVRFVSQQAPMYKFGLRQFEINADWTKWREYKSKKKEGEMKLEEWYKKYAEDENPYTLEDFNSLF